MGGSTALPNALGASAEIRQGLSQDIGRVAGRMHLAHVELARCPSGLQPQASELDVLRHPEPLASGVAWHLIPKSASPLCNPIASTPAVTPAYISLSQLLSATTFCLRDQNRNIAPLCTNMPPLIDRLLSLKKRPSPHPCTRSGGFLTCTTESKSTRAAFRTKNRAILKSQIVSPTRCFEATEQPVPNLVSGRSKARAHERRSRRSFQWHLLVLGRLPRGGAHQRIHGLRRAQPEFLNDLRRVPLVGRQPNPLLDPLDLPIQDRQLFGLPPRPGHKDVHTMSGTCTWTSHRSSSRPP